MKGALNLWLTPPGTVFLKAGMSFLLSVFFFWVYYRLNQCKLFLYMALTLICHSLFFILFFREQAPSPAGLLLMIPIGISFLAILTAMTVSGLAQLNTKLVIIHEGQYINTEDGTVKGKILPVISFVLAIILGFFFKHAWQYFKDSTGGMIPLLFFFIGVIGAAWLANKIMPYAGEGNVAILGEDRPRLQLENVFQINGTVNSTEVFVVPVGLVTAWGIVIFMINKSANLMDMWGLVVLIGLALLILRSEMKKKR
ncbi:MAG: hypothetical protein AB2L14_09415 [Candidatus Xenobiia bacterium LiM19]